MKAKTFRELRDQLADPLLTALTIMLAILLFVIAPLQTGGVVAAHNFGIAFGLVLVAAVFIVSESWIAVAAILLAVALIVAATIFRLRQPSIIDIYLESSAWLITSLTLAVVVGRAVFARGKINYHRVIGGVLLYLNIGMFFVALYVFAALLVHNAFTGLGPLEDNLTVAGNLIYFSFVTLTSVGYGDIVPLHPVVRGISNVEAIIGQLYPATLLARLVTLQLEHRQH